VFFVLYALLPIAAVIGLFLLCWHAPDVRSRWRSARGRCSGCGYTRTGEAPGERCPECGHNHASGAR
jgi:rRNA maturation endonuclease Nob1